MKPIVRYALLLSAVVLVAGGIAWAMLGKTDQATVSADVHPASNYVAMAGTRAVRGSGGKLFAQYDLDQDGRITRDEFSRGLSSQFAQNAAGAQTMTQAQYLAYRMTGLRQRADQSFRRDDWNGDGKLSLDEYLAPERARFESADRDGTGSIRCTSRALDDSSDTNGRAADFGGRSGGARAAICRYEDLNHDGVVTRTEFDQAMQQEFASAAKGGALNADQFYAITASHVHESATRTFARLDANQDGKLDLAEFSASELRYFGRLDRNGDGVVTHDEIGAGRRTASGNSRNPRGS